MKVQVLLPVAFLLSAQLCLAQLSVQSDQANVTIGPDGIHVETKDTAGGASVHIGGSSVSPRVGATRVNAGGAAHVEIDSLSGARRSVHIKSVQGSSISKRATGKLLRSTSTASKASTSHRVGAGAENVADLVGQVELRVYGQSYQSLPLVARIEKLETDNLGRKGSGPLKARILTVASELGIELRPVSMAVGSRASAVAASGTSVSIQSNSAGAPGQSISISGGGTGGCVSVQDLDSSLVMNEDGAHITGRCNGGTVVVNANDCQLDLKGTCGSLTVNGNNNRIRSDRLGSVVTNGDGNRIFWARTSRTPGIVNNGSGNSLQPE